MDAFLGGLRAEGQLHSSGTFSIDRLRVGELFQNAQKAEPSLYYLKAIQAAVASGSPRVDLKLLSSAVRVIFYPPHSVADQVQALFHQSGEGIAEYVRWSVHCALAAGVRNVRCRLQGPEARDNVEFVFRAQGSTVEPLARTAPTHRVELAFEGFRATSDVRTLLGIHERLRLLRAVDRRCGFGVTPIYLEGRLQRPDLSLLVAGGAKILAKVSRPNRYAFNIVKLGRRGQPDQIVTYHPQASWPSAIISAPFTNPQIRSLYERRPFHLLNVPEKCELVWEEDRALGILPKKRQGNYAAPHTLRLLARQRASSYPFLSKSTVVCRYGLGDCGECIDEGRVIAQCHIVGSRELGMGNYLYVIKHGIMLQPLAFELGRREVIAVLADSSVNTDASGMSPIYDEHFEGLVESIRAAFREAVD